MEVLRELLFCPEHGLLVVGLRYPGVVLMGAASALSGGVMCRTKLIGMISKFAASVRGAARSVAGL